MPIALDPARTPRSPLGVDVHAPRSHRRRSILIWLIALAIVVLVFAPVLHMEYFSCATCGDRLRTKAFLGIPIGRTEEVTECGLWFRQHVESDHSHIWCRGTFAETSSVLGVRILSSNIAGRASGPLFTQASGLKLLIYQCAPDPHLVRDIFLRLARWDRSTPEASRRQWQTLQDLERWAEEGCPGDRSPQ